MAEIIAAQISNRRFTIDGSDALEQYLENLCQRLAQRLRGLLPGRSLEAIVLGGGYGRGEGGVLRSAAGDAPYNDIEFYVFLRGNRLWNERRLGGRMISLSQELSEETRLHVEFKIESLRKLQRSAVTMFSYDLVVAHRIIFGPQDFFKNCTNHLNPAAIPLSEATRLLFNRCGGLILVREILEAATNDKVSGLSSEQADFVTRNLAKAQLALGDAVLAFLGKYHWSVKERRLRMARLTDPAERRISDLNRIPNLVEIAENHLVGVEFKLQPRLESKPIDKFRAAHTELSRLAADLWLFLENKRLNKQFASPQDYAFDSANKYPKTLSIKNYLLNLRTFGPRGALDRMGK